MSEEAKPPLIKASDLTEVVSRYMSAEDISRVYSAFLLAAEAHEGVVRKSGEFYIFHPLEVAHTLAEFHMDADTVCAALLHDVIEDTDFSKEDITKQFGKVVADLVDGVTKLAGGEFNTKQEAAAASFQKMMAAMTQDYRVVLIKLADRLHNVKTLGVRSPASRRRIAKETLDIHVPLARRMGMNTMRKDLQINAFKHLHPWRAKLLAQALEKFNADNEEKHQEIVSNISQALSENNLKAQVFRWNKNIYKVYKRIERSNGRKRIINSKEALEVRVLVDTTNECYLTLGILHQLFHPKLGSFKDFIATPKGYGFQALQTALLTPQRQLIFVQIQSHEMYQIAQYGIVAPKRYPELLKSSDKSQMYLNRWLQQVEEIQKVTGNAAEFLEDMKADLFLSEIYVSTPRGEVKVLPKGATPIDFAYSIHTEVGDKCVSAVIDGEPARLNTALPNGATVLILTDEEATPHSSWLNYVITAKARSSIRGWINKRKTHEFLSLGKQILDKALQPYNHTLKSIPKENFDLTLKALDLKNTDALYISVAKGSQSAKLVARRLLNDDRLIPLSEEENKDQLLLIKGTEGLAVHLQPCCYPIPNDMIVARLDEQSGLEVHRANCPALSRNSRLNQKDIFSIAWVDDTSQESHFLAALNVQVRNRVGVLSHITDLLEKMQVNIEDINISGDRDIKDMYFLIQVSDATHLRKIAEAINNLHHVLDVARVFEKTS
ncbi:RelA/SpoT family protein [Cocleimonas sp. KMM 6892]|uniref:RelA/SpoT family protein n=1 Tax=unclassified Cocleimonas TaxID=2639732 RepID=UPI002DB6C6A4|nr:MULTISPECIES: RelA/SpoT family protein [unclassified Cocleimonas]MEB8431625.1 RelA/SpoT family protein [Cocleimonas sp. KMM 6892]MEC4713603.1 RelA/SpoT family protein [Cocleimonas sp. KMM 6895]MEC4742934.1 RelA/SpoT family protein [Cocleimonas sp. KMM 6896]